ncbi:MAG: hypothetical protein WCT51_04635, partial [Candidatus Shapirobacteria bacterium]
PLFETLYFKSQKNPIDSKIRLSEIKKATDNINKILLKDRLNQISNQITNSEIEENNEEFDKLFLEQKQIMEKLHQLQTVK